MCRYLRQIDFRTQVKKLKHSAKPVMLHVAMHPEIDVVQLSDASYGIITGDDGSEGREEEGGVSAPEIIAFGTMMGEETNTRRVSSDRIPTPLPRYLSLTSHSRSWCAPGVGSRFRPSLIRN